MNKCTAVASEPMAIQPAIARQNVRGVWLYNQLPATASQISLKEATERDAVIAAFTIRLTARRTKQFVAEANLKAWNYAELREELHGSSSYKETRQTAHHERVSRVISGYNVSRENTRKHVEMERSATDQLKASRPKKISILTELICMQKRQQSLCLWSSSRKSYKIEKSASLNFLLTSKLLVCVCVCVSVCLCVLLSLVHVLENNS